MTNKNKKVSKNEKIDEQDKNIEVETKEESKDPKKV